jgi:hypothetical protein
MVKHETIPRMQFANDQRKDKSSGVLNKWSAVTYANSLTPTSLGVIAIKFAMAANGIAIAMLNKRIKSPAITLGYPALKMTTPILVSENSSRRRTRSTCAKAATELWKNDSEVPASFPADSR